MVISLVLIAVAAVCNACMDTLAHHWDTSIFKDISAKRGSLFWADATQVSWRNKYVNGDPAQGRVKWKIFGFIVNKPVQFTDGWHLTKMIMIFTLCAAVVCYHTKNSLITETINFVVLGTVWNVVFSLFYDKLFRTKK